MAVDASGKPLVMEIAASAWTGSAAMPPAELAERLSARTSRTAEDVLRRHQQRMQTAEEVRAAKAEAEAARLRREREREADVRARGESAEHERQEAVAGKSSAKRKSAEGIASRQAARRTLAAERKRQRERAAKARLENASRTFGSTTLDDEDKLRLLTLVKENQLGPLREMAETGELGRLRNFQNHYGDSALILAAWYGHLDAAAVLLEVNADVDIANCDGNTALNCAAYRGHGAVVELLLAEGAEVDVPDDVTGKTALVKASYGGHSQCVRALLEAEADPDALDAQGYGALAFAASFGHHDVLHALLEYEADPDSTDQFGITPLIHAAARGDEEATHALLRHGAVPTKEDVEGKSALDYAESAGFDEVVALLSDYAVRHPDAAGGIQSSSAQLTARVEAAERDCATRDTEGAETQRQYAAAPPSHRHSARAPLSQRGGHTPRLTPRMPPPQASARPRIALGGVAGVGDVANALGTPRGFRGMKAPDANAVSSVRITPDHCAHVDAKSMAYLAKKLFNLSVLLEQDTVSEDHAYPTFA